MKLMNTTIHKRADGPFAQPKQKWSDIILRLMADGERFEDVHIVTLKSHYNSVVEQTVIEQTLRYVDDDEKFQQQLEKRKQKVLKNNTIKVRQFVELDPFTGMLIICLDVDKIDDNTLNVAMDVLSTIEFTGNRIEFGEAKSFSVNKKPFLTDLKPIC